jgi:hypothetical protein
MSPEETGVDAGAAAARPSAARAVEGPPGLGAWLGESRDLVGQPRLEWQSGCGDHPGKLVRPSLQVLDRKT